MIFLFRIQLSGQSGETDLCPPYSRREKRSAGAGRGGGGQKEDKGKEIRKKLRGNPLTYRSGMDYNRGNDSARAGEF